MHLTRSLVIWKRTMWTNFGRHCRRKVHVFGIALCVFYICLFLALNQAHESYAQSTSGYLEKPKKNNIESTTTNRFVSHPWSGDPSCQHFTVQVLTTTILQFVIYSGSTWSHCLIRMIQILKS